METSLVAFLDACFEFADVGPNEAQRGRVANLLKVLAIHPRSLSKNDVVGSMFAIVVSSFLSNFKLHKEIPGGYALQSRRNSI